MSSAALKLSVIAAIEAALRHLRATNAPEALALTQARADLAEIWFGPTLTGPHWLSALVTVAHATPQAADEPYDRYEQRLLATLLDRLVPEEQRASRTVVHGCRHGVGRPVVSFVENPDDDTPNDAETLAAETVGVDYVVRDTQRVYALSIARSVVAPD